MTTQTTPSHKLLAVDLNGIAFACYFKAFPNKTEFSKELLIHQIIVTLKSVDYKFGADSLLIACDSRNVWRRDVYPAYKANRKTNRDPNYKGIIEAIAAVRDFYNECSSIPAIGVDRCEADDVISGLVDLRGELQSDTEIIIVSADKDFVQLIRPGVRLYSPTQKVERFTDDAKYSLFLKCIRGDVGDNIFSAYPRVRETAIKQAYNDPIHRMNLMETVKNGNRVGDIYELNRKLIDLSTQPTEIKTTVNLALKAALGGYARYNQIGCLRFFGKHGLLNLGDDISSHKPMLRKTFELRHK